MLRVKKLNIFSKGKVQITKIRVRLKVVSSNSLLRIIIMARSKKCEDENKIDPSAVHCNVKSTVQSELMKELLSDSFDDEITKINNEGLSLVVEVAKCLVTETCLRASSCALQEHCDKVGINHVEKCLTQVMLDFP